MRADSEGPGKGSTFEIRLPRIAAPAQRQKRSPRSPIVPRRILVVDDNTDAADSLAELLRLDGHDVHAVYSATDALQRIESFRPAVVLLDIGLPEMDGYQVARQIRASTHDIRLVALTGYGQTEDILRTHSSGFDAHLVKPVDFDALQTSIAGT